MKRKRVTSTLGALALALWLIAPPVALAQSQASKQAGASAIGRSATTYRSLRSLRADFVQMINTPMIDSVQSRGTLTQTGQANFAMHFSDPAGDAIVVDGEYIWVYTPSTTPGQVIRSPLKSGGVYGYNILSWLLDKPAERYDATLLRTERGTTGSVDVVELLPKVPDLPFNRATIWLDRGDGLPRKIEIFEKSGTHRTLALSKLRVNPKVAPKTFKLALPAKTRIIDQ